MRVLTVFSLLCFSLFGLAGTHTRSPTDWVDPRIGTSGGGQTFPAIGVPFGMTQWTPQTRRGELKCVAPYYASDARIQGFRGSHFMSGSCTKDYGSVTLMPLSGKLRLGEVARSSLFFRSTEVMTPYRYGVTLSRYDIRAEMTGTTRASCFALTTSTSHHVQIESASLPRASFPSSRPGCRTYST